MSDARRLRCAREFDAVFNNNELRASSRFFLVLGMSNGMETSRLGTVVSKKVAGNAVNRNRIRRLIKESFRQDFSLPGLDIVVVARQEAGRGENINIFNALQKLWRSLEEQLVS